jgi:hypothetical protein
MKKFIFASIISCLLAFGVSAQVVKKEMTQAEVDKIVKSFSDHEAEFRQILTGFAFNRKVVFQTIGMGGQITGEYRRESFMDLSPKNLRQEKIIFFPMPTIKDVTISADDLEDINGVNMFALAPENISKYAFTYIGIEKIDDLELYVFDTSPKVMPSPKNPKDRLFQGRIWVDTIDLALVKSKGKGVPETKQNKFPTVELWRENVDGKYWFPSFASSDDELIFDNGYSIKVKLRTKYNNYFKKGKSEVVVLDDDDPSLKTMTAPTPTPTPKKP